MSKKESVDFEIRGVFVPWCFETLTNQEHTLIVVHSHTVDILISTVENRVREVPISLYRVTVLTGKVPCGLLLMKS